MEGKDKRSLFKEFGGRGYTPAERDRGFGAPDIRSDDAATEQPKGRGAI